MIQSDRHIDHNELRFSETRPIFASAKDWLTHYEFCVQHKHEPWPAANREEFILADAHGILDCHQEWIPCAAQLRHWGLSPRFGRTHEPFSEFWKERFLASLNTDREFASAVFCLIQGEG